MELLSAFVLAALIAAVLLVNYTGGSEELARRFFQVAVAGTLAFCVISGTNAFVSPHSNGSQTISEILSSAGSGNSNDLQNGANRIVASRTIDLGVGVLAILIGISLMRQLSTVPLGVTLGGLLLILFGGASTPTSSYAQAVSDALAASREMDVVNFVITVIAFVVLVWFGVRQWENLGDDEPDDADESDDLVPE